MPQPDGSHLVRGGARTCARLLVLLRRATLHLTAGDVVHLETDDPIAPIDLPAWCRMTRHDYLGEVDDRHPPRYAIRIADSPRSTSPASPWRLN
ncbi:sulfurtransferase TusA family protein [Nocardioides sp. BGMRC 2183]|nr:sulfurtransferase TusA family protein [Nocardioides sp. BGMRC 2183]